ncbi:MAG: 4Fe-4S binding protein [Anaerolineae bacterium]
MTRSSFIKGVLRQRAFQWALTVPALFSLVLTILAGLWGTPVGNRNFAVIFVWIIWWALLILFLIPLGGRAWCAMCPIPMPGEWLQRRSFIGKRDHPSLSRRWRWPRWFRNIWLQNFAFLGVALFSATILTNPLVTGALLLAFVLIALGLSLGFERRTFCRYVCPVGGFIGLYSMLAPLELRVKDREVCQAHKGRECYLGSQAGYGCPWLTFPGKMERNAYCGLCTECLKTCPEDNIALNLRPLGLDLLVARERGLDEAYKAFVMVACALLYSVVLLGPWGWLKEWADPASLSTFVPYAIMFLTVNLLLLPGLFLAFTVVAQALGGIRAVPTRDLFIDFAYALVPMGLAGWMAFSISFVLVNLSYALPVISDPFGWGWNLFGTSGYPWTPYWPQIVPYLQVPILLGGLLFSIYIAYRIAQQNSGDRRLALRALVPITLFLTGLSFLFEWLYL